MAKYRSRLPQLSDRLFLTDAGMETFLIFHEGVELPYFASFDLMKNDEGIAQVRRYYERFIAMARKRGLGFVLESPTWRANPDWAAKLGYDKASARADQPAHHRGDGAAARPVRDGANADRDLGQHRPARRRLQPGSHHERERGAGLSRRAGRGVRRERGRPRERVHDQLRQ